MMEVRSRQAPRAPPNAATGVERSKGVQTVLPGWIKGTQTHWYRAGGYQEDLA